ncbi:MAG: DegT/DnrJ/EryC1/StrS family aminotransferase [Candidatus Omnitrophota bacterium]
MTVPREKISKKAVQIDRSLRRGMFFESARAGFKAFLKEALGAKAGKVLLPSYIGWSPKEGSGVFDPVEESGVDAVFYKVSDRLRIDLQDVEKCLNNNDIDVAVIIHYFGYVDPGYREFTDLARKAGALVFEDEAHSMFSDLIGGICGRLGDAGVYSLHKLLPLDKGGILFLNNRRSLEGFEGAPVPELTHWDYDLFEISRRRRENCLELSNQLKSLAGEVDLLWPSLGDGVIPQTLPVLIQRVSRDRLYEEMNARGYGVVSLYHTLIRPIGSGSFPVSYGLSRRIMNLPVHQDLTVKELGGLVDGLRDCVRKLGGKDMFRAQ